MILRIVKLSIAPHHRKDFIAFIQKKQQDILASKGCKALDIAENKEDEIFCTVSKWEDEESLNLYRSSKLFGEIWPHVKPMMHRAPEAITLQPLESLL